MAGRGIDILRTSKRFGSVAALDDVTISINAGEFITLLGPSGSGKTTLLMALAGFVQLDDGQIMLDGRSIERLSPEARGFGVVFQGYALFPTMTVEENLAFPLQVRRAPKDRIATRVAETLDMLQLTAHRSKLPRQLSGGQQQRVALGRALIYEPAVLLLDEPLSALDQSLREELQWELKSLHRRLGLTFVNVTHDQHEALSLSDRVAILRGGRLVQEGAPAQLYREPATRFVAEFLGGANIAIGRIIGRQDGFTILQSGGVDWRVKDMGGEEGQDLTVAIRPETLSIGAGDPGSNRLTGTIEESIFTGAYLRVRLRTALGVLIAEVPPAFGAGLHAGDVAEVGFSPCAVSIVQPD